MTPMRPLRVLEHPRFSGGISRRQLLQVGGIGMLGLGLPELLRGAAPAPAARAAGGEQKSCIFIFQYGGASHLDSWDPKPAAPLEIRGPYQPISTAVPGLHVGELLPRLAGLADRYCLVRSMTHHSGAHEEAINVSLTGQTRPAERAPYFGSVMAKLRPATRKIPSYVWLQNLSADVSARYLTGGFLGSGYSPMRVGTDLDNPSAPAFRMKAFDAPTEVSCRRVRERYKLLAAVEPPGSPLLQGAGGSMRRFQELAVDLVTGPRARRAFELKHEPARVRDRYGRHPLGQNLLLARRLIEAGVRLVSVAAWTGTPPGETFRNVITWDMHGGVMGNIFGSGQYGLGWALPRLDQAVSGLVEDLEQRGLLQSTLVVMVGEFGRHPKIADAGRDHWPACYSALLAGAGVRGGAVHGASDREGAYVHNNPVTPEDFGATLFHALGVPPDTRLGADGFTGPASTGRPIWELFS
jgi:uncharacterized protein (DUF1501 family)